MAPASLDQTRTAEDTYLTALRTSRAFPDAFVNSTNLPKRISTNTRTVVDADPWTSMQVAFRSARSEQRKLKAANTRLKTENAALKKKVEEPEAQRGKTAVSEEDIKKRKRKEDLEILLDEELKKRSKTSNGNMAFELIRTYRADSGTDDSETRFQKQQVERKGFESSAASKEPGS